ncbi:hypothetical protein [Enterococcus sp. AZ126]|uniref:hypothetical protein n=1 Tax=Enterococcus sp. AZ126 TaxID=2774635 RepID=UPI003F24622C
MKRLKNYRIRGSNNLSILEDEEHKQICFQVKDDFYVAPLNRKLVKELIKDLEGWLEEEAE